MSGVSPASGHAQAPPALHRERPQRFGSRPALSVSVVECLGQVGAGLAEALAHLGCQFMRLGCGEASALVDGVSFDPFPFEQDGLAAPEVDVGRRQVAEALVVAR